MDAATPSSLSNKRRDYSMSGVSSIWRRLDRSAGLTATAAFAAAVTALSRSEAIERSSFVVGAVALAVAFVAALWSVWLSTNHRSPAVKWLTAMAMGLLAVAQIATAIVVIDNEYRDHLPLWVDVLRGIGALAGAAAIAMPRLPRAESLRRALDDVLSSLVVTAVAFLAIKSNTEISSNWNLSSAVGVALMFLPLTAGILALGVSRSGTDNVGAAVTLGSAWLCATIALAGFGIERLARQANVSGATSWFILPSAYLFCRAFAADVRHDKHRESTRIASWFGVPDHSRQASRFWLTALLPMLATAAGAAIAVLSPQPFRVIAVACCVVLLTRYALSYVLATKTANQLEAERIELATMAVVDPVTRLPNRRAVDERLHEEVERAVRYRQPLSVCYVDIDHFKRVNDTHGHATGDMVLREVGVRLRATVRGIDFVGRLGGEEFIVLAPGTWTEDASILGERLRRAVSHRAVETINGPALQLTVSIGIAGLPEHGTDGTALGDAADSALYIAKRAGRNQIVVYDPPEASDEAEARR